jgi:non-homologous end joining protein Ku
VVDLMAALKQSLAEMEGKKKPATAASSSRAEAPAQPERKPSRRKQA